MVGKLFWTASAVVADGVRVARTFFTHQRKERNMKRATIFLQISISAVLVCGLRLYGQGADPRMAAVPLSSRAATAAKAAGGKEAQATFSAAALPAATAVGTFITFDAPGAVFRTSPLAINNTGAVTGSYGDNVGSGSHGFVRAANGSFATFDAPGAVFGTFPLAINNSSAVTGSYGDNVGSGFHGFVRGPDGRIITFDVPVAVFGTEPIAINSQGEVTGSYFDVNGVGHTFLREASGAVTTFDPPGAINGSFPSMITDDGVILGVYFDASFNTHGFVRTSSGAFSEISGPDGLSGQANPFNPGPALTINPVGVIAGTYFEPIAGNPYGGNFRVFLLSKSGEYTTFDAASYPPCCIWSAPSRINPAGTVTGSFNDGFTINHGFVRTSDGVLTTFDAPGAGAGFNQGTLPVGITPGGIIVGQYRDATSVTHGFLLLTSGQ